MTSRPRKRFGQHFLEPAWVAKVLEAIAPSPDQTFVEIGPGRGALTAPLAVLARSVIACEIDRDLAARLRASHRDNVTVVEGDFLKLSAAEFAHLTAAARGALRVAGNLPYNVASPILFQLCRFSAAGLPLLDATLMLQREVADRLTANPGSHDYSPMTILVGRRARVARLLALPPGAFRPAPRVHSALVRLEFHAPTPAALDEGLLESLVRAIFTRRRKVLTNALQAFPASQATHPSLALARAQLDGRRRPETLTSTELVRLADVYASTSKGAVL